MRMMGEERKSFLEVSTGQCRKVSLFLLWNVFLQLLRTAGGNEGGGVGIVRMEPLNLIALRSLVQCSPYPFGIPFFSSEIEIKKSNGSYFWTSCMRSPRVFCHHPKSHQTLSVTRTR